MTVHFPANILFETSAAFGPGPIVVPGTAFSTRWRLPTAAMNAKRLPIVVELVADPTQFIEVSALYTHAGTSLSWTAADVTDGSNGPGALVTFDAGAKRIASIARAFDLNEIANRASQDTLIAGDSDLQITTPEHPSMVLFNQTLTMAANRLVRVHLAAGFGREYVVLHQALGGFTIDIVNENPASPGNFFNVALGVSNGETVIFRIRNDGFAEVVYRGLSIVVGGRTGRADYSDTSPTVGVDGAFVHRLHTATADRTITITARGVGDRVLIVNETAFIFTLNPGSLGGAYRSMFLAEWNGTAWVSIYSLARPSSRLAGGDVQGGQLVSLAVANYTLTLDDGPFLSFHSQPDGTRKVFRPTASQGLFILQNFDAVSPITFDDGTPAVPGNLYTIPPQRTRIVYKAGAIWGVSLAFGDGASYQAVTAAAAQAGYAITRTGADIMVRLTEDLNVNGTFARPGNAQVGDQLTIVRQGGGTGLWSLVGGDTSDVLRARDDRIEYQCITAPNTWVRVLPSGRDKRLVYRHDGATTPTLLLTGGFDGVDIVVHSGPVVVTGPQDLGTRFHCRLIQQSAANPVSFLVSGAAVLVAGAPVTTVGAGDELDVLVVQNVTGAAAVYRTLRHVPLLAAGAIIPAAGGLDLNGVPGDVLTVLPGGGIGPSAPTALTIEPQTPTSVAVTPYLLGFTEGLEDQKWVRADAGSSVFRIPKAAGAGRVWVITNGTNATKEIEIEDDAAGSSINSLAAGGSVFLAAGIGRKVSIRVESNASGLAPVVQIEGDLTGAKALDGPLIEPAPVVANATGAATFNFATAGVQRCTVTGNISSVAISNPPPANMAGMLTLIFVQDATGTRTIGWGGAFRFIGGADVSLATGNGAISIFTLMTWDGGTTWFVSEVGKGWAA